MRKCLAALLGLSVLAVGSLSWADKPTIAEIRYMQMLDLIGKVHGAMSDNFEKIKDKTPKLARYCEALTRFNRQQLGRNKPPHKVLVPAHKASLGMLDNAQAFYRELARGKLVQARAFGLKAIAQWRKLNREMKKLKPRYR